MLFTAGACPLDAAGQVVAPGDFEAQAQRTVDNLEAVLAEAGAGVGDLARTTVYVVGDAERLVEVWNVVAARLAPHRPASTLLGVAALGYPGQLVEIDGVAVVPEQTQHLED
jgi:enamine deaminase RidA (YjgF/YER057c/UK114 family)